MASYEFVKFAPLDVIQSSANDMDMWETNLDDEFDDDFEIDLHTN